MKHRFIFSLHWPHLTAMLHTAPCMIDAIQTKYLVLTEGQKQTSQMNTVRMSQATQKHTDLATQVDHVSVLIIEWKDNSVAGINLLHDDVV